MSVCRSKVLSQEWGLDLSYFHLINTQDLSEIINRFIKNWSKRAIKRKGFNRLPRAQRAIDSIKSNASP